MPKDRRQRNEGVCLGVRYGGGGYNPKLMIFGSDIFAYLNILVFKLKKKKTTSKTAICFGLYSNIGPYKFTPCRMVLTPVLEKPILYEIRYIYC